MMKTKLCCDCRAVKPVDQFARRAASASGLQHHCKACQTLRNRAYYEANRDRERQRANEHRVVKPEQGTEAKARYRAANPERVAEQQRVYRAVNLERLRAARIANHSQNRERELARNRAWKLVNKPKVIAAIARRTAAKLQATVAWADRAKVEEFYFAADFLGMVTGDWYHVDHQVPLQSKIVCGLHCEANLQVIPGAENQSKSNRFWPDMPDRAGV
jgi:hypothetical protein